MSTMSEYDVTKRDDFPSITDIKLALPPHCFRPKVWLSLYYFVRDLLIMASLLAILMVTERLASIWPYLAFLPVYWLLQSTMLAGLFVVGHDCGHESFSSSWLLNDIVGNVAHAICMTPYYPWKLSHRNHHKNTGNMDKDEVFYPKRESDGAQSTPAPLFGLGIGWFYYLIFGYYPRQLNHFNPLDPMMVEHFVQCTISLMVLVLWTTFGLMNYANLFGMWALVSHYVVPVLGFATWIVIITFLHHHDDHVPWYGDSSWNYVKGQLSTVDRKYGFVFDEMLHHIGTHQVHHLFTKIPHYHLEEATKAFRAKFPHLVRISDENLLVAYVRMFNVFAKQCVVDDKTQIHVYDSSKISQKKE